MDLTPYLKLISEKNAEALVLKIGSPPTALLDGQNMPIGKTALDAKLTKEIAFEILDDAKKKELILNKTISFDYKSANNLIFTATIALETEGISLTFKPGGSQKSSSFEAMEIPGSVQKKPAFEELEIPGKAQAAASAQPAPTAKPELKSEAKTVDTNEVNASNVEVLGAAPTSELDLFPYLSKMIEIGASDLYVTSGSSLKAKVSGCAVELDKFVLTPELSRSAVLGLMSQLQREEFETTKDLDFAIAMPDGKARFRVNAFYQRGTIGLVTRLIPSKIPNAQEMGLPEILTELVMAKRGLLLVVGGTGTGKSTTLAAMINHRNANSQGHILTIEDPIEFSHPNLLSIVNQREVGIDSASYARALKASLREAPDVILIGEIRDEETMEAALELANTGHLCISTMHANNANQAMERIINMFPQVRHQQLLMDIATNLNAVVSQRLIPDVTGKRCAAIEVMINTPHIGSLILKGELYSIKDAMSTSGVKGMITFDNALYTLYKEGRISLEETLRNADSSNDMEAKINFG